MLSKMRNLVAVMHHIVCDESVIELQHFAETERGPGWLMVVLLVNGFAVCLGDTSACVQNALRMTLLPTKK